MANPWEMTFVAEKNPWEHEYVPAEGHPVTGISERAKVNTDLTFPEQVASNLSAAYGYAKVPFEYLADKLPAIEHIGQMLPSTQDYVDVATGMSGIMRGTANLAGKPFGADKAGEKVWPSTQARKDSGYTTLGELADPVALAIGGGVTKVLPMAEKGTPFLKSLYKNALSGGAAGGAIGALSDKGTTVEGAGFGAGAGILLPYAVRGAAKFAGWTADAFQKRLSDIKAGKVVRDVAGDELTQIYALAKASGDDVTAAQAVEAAKSVKFSALGKLAAAHDAQYTNDLLARQSQSYEDTLRQLAGGATQTEVKKRTGEAVTNLGLASVPTRDKALEQANIAGRLFPQYMAEAEQLAAAAEGKVEDVRRFAAAEQRARDIANNTQPVAGMPRVSGKYSYMGEQGGLADRAAQMADKAAMESLALGDGARFALIKANSLAENGLKPIDISGVLGKIDDISIAPDMEGNNIAKGVLAAVKNDIVSAAQRNGGLIDAFALDSIRKNSINAAIEQQLSGSDPKTKQQTAAYVLKTLKPVISQAIVDAGGTEYPAYLKTYEEGMKLIYQQKLGGKALEMFNKNPDSFIELVKGNDPKLVQKIFNTDFDIKSAMGQKFIKMQQVADNLVRDKNIDKLAASGETALKDALAKNLQMWSLPNILNRKVTLINTGLNAVEEKMSKRVMNKIYMGMRSGKDIARLIDTLPSSEIIPTLKYLQTANAAAKATSQTISAGEGQ